jgi:hypothetical protein
MAKSTNLGLVLLVATVVTGCGTEKEKTAPCKRPAELTSFAEDPRHECGPMRPVSDPAAAFAAIGMIDSNQR